jgi:hypothetical protein
MIFVRILAYAALGAVVAAAVLIGLQYYILTTAHADLSEVGLRTLLVDVMDAPRYAGLGAVLGAVLAPFPWRGRNPVARLLAWTTAGLLAGLVAPTVQTALELDHLPTFAEALARLALDAKALIAGTATGLVLSWVETAVEAIARARLRRRIARGESGELNDVDAALKAFWRERAEVYLASRERR